jgi:hypothetical protein
VHQFPHITQRFKPVGIELSGTDRLHHRRHCRQLALLFSTMWGWCCWPWLCMTLAFATGYLCALYRTAGLRTPRRHHGSRHTQCRPWAGADLQLFGGLGGMAVVAGVWGFWDIIAGLAGISMGAQSTSADHKHHWKDSMSSPFPPPKSSDHRCRWLGRSVVQALSQRLAPMSWPSMCGPYRQSASCPACITASWMCATRACPDAARHAIDTVVHWHPSSPQGKDSNRALEYDVDVNGSRNVLSACVAQGVRHVVVSSSGAAYGYHADNPDWLKSTTRCAATDICLFRPQAAGGGNAG